MQHKLSRSATIYQNDPDAREHQQQRIFHVQHIFDPEIPSNTI